VLEICKTQFITYEKGMAIFIGFVAVLLTVAVTITWNVQGRTTAIEYKLEGVGKDVSFVRIQYEKDKVGIDSLNNSIKTLNVNVQRLAGKYGK
jgi:hypothetical protein